MPKLPMTAMSHDLTPSICFQHPKNVANGHAVAKPKCPRLGHANGTAVVGGEALDNVGTDITLK
jgi:hypothetical protein